MGEAPDSTRVLVVDDDASFRNTLLELVGAHGYEATGRASAREALDFLQESSVDLIITDLVMPGALAGEGLVREVRDTFPEIPVIAVTAFGSVEGALDLVRAGAADYLVKPFRTQALLDTMRRVLAESASLRTQARVRREMGAHLEGIVGGSAPMLRLFERIGRVAVSPASVLVTGETGTGKELVARAVHRASGREPFVAVNCGAIPEQLLESELFGHVKGSFTGAVRDKPGLFETAHGGTLFLDEVGELPLSLQPKFLRALETGEIRRVGDTRARPVDVRVLAATHRDLQKAVDDHIFREDLFWRLAVLRLEIPPLRARSSDIPLLVDAYLTQVSARLGREVSLDPSALAALMAYPWPGNVRQLLNTLEAALTFASGTEIRLPDLPEEIRSAARSAELVRSAAEHELTLAELEKAYIMDVLRNTGGNKSLAAERLGIPRRTLYRRLQEYDRGDEDLP